MTKTNENFQSKFLKTVSERGFLHQGTDNAALDALLLGGEQGKKPVVCYIGFDCTAPSLHVGSLIQIMMLRHWQKAGHKPIVLMGGGTTKIGDPSGKDESRQLLTDEKIAENMAGIKQVFAKFLDFGDGPTDAMMVNNADWLAGLNYIDFLRDYGRLFSVNRMLGMQSVKLRLERESHLSFLEFNYMILQAYDFVELNQRHHCRLQIGGSDQWGNIVQGIELQRKIQNPINVQKNFNLEDEDSPLFTISQNALTPDLMMSEIESTISEMSEVTGDIEVKITIEAIDKDKNESIDKSVFGLTTPLLTTSSGAKMGKTASGAVWLNAEMFSPYDYWQFWRNVEDADVGRFLKLFTELPMEEIARLEALPGSEINEAKKILATEATVLLHGRETAKQAAETAKQTFEQGLTAETLPEVTIEVADSIAAFQLFAAAGLAASGGEARRLIQGGGARLNDEKVDDPTRAYSRAELESLAPLKLSSGKKNHVRVKVA